MDLKIRLFLLMTVLGIALYHVQGNKMCDWPRGTCTYYKDPCPPDWGRCAQYDYDCPVKTNHCCCRKYPPHPTPKPKPRPNVCDWPRGTCTYIKDPCPPDWERCPKYDVGCRLSTNHCCCRKYPPKSDGNKMCDWPRGTCTYYKDPCPPNWERCPQYDYDCPLSTNHCCCRKNPPHPTPKPKPRPNVCDWPRGTCTYIKDPCPPDWERCPQYDVGCKLSTNHCCCRKYPPKSDGTVSCDWPEGVCTYIPECPPNFVRCPKKDSGCKLTNHCCCFINEQPKSVYDAPTCDYPKGMCTYVGDPCPENMERCSQNDKGCPSETNHCCCHVKTAEPVKDVPKVEALDKPCDWPNGTCTYTGDPCPPNWQRCPSLDGGCKFPTNHCCCRTRPPPPPGKCDWPRGTCTYYKDPCPPGWKRCPAYDLDCELRTNHCCCRG